MMKNLRNGALAWMAFVTLTASAVRIARADQVFNWTNYSNNQLMQTDVTTNQTTVLETIPNTVIGHPDSMVFDSSGNILYTVDAGFGPNGGEVRMYNPTTNVDSAVATGLSSSTLDLQLLPDGSVAVSDSGANQVLLVDPTTGNATVLIGNLADPNGIAYDGNGHLFVNSFNGATSSVYEFDTSGNQLGVSASVSGLLDGLTYDAGTSTLYAASNNCLVTFSVTLTQGSSCVGLISSNAVIDGVVSGGDGNIYYADSANGQVDQYNIKTGAATNLFTAYGVDDLAPLSGLGSAPVTTDSVPEPASLISMVGLSLIAFIGLRRRQTSC